MMAATSSTTTAASATHDAAAKGSQWKTANCPRCTKRRCFYCPDCHVPVGIPDGVVVPRLKLPLKVDLIFQDVKTKSTGPQAKVMAPEDVALLPLAGQLPTWDPKTTVVVFPSPAAVTMDELGASPVAGRPRLEDLERVVLIDTPWKKAKALSKTPQIKALTQVRLGQGPTHSRYWRFHKEGAGCVSTLEAMYYVLLEYVRAAAKADEEAAAGSGGVAASARVQTDKAKLDQLFFFFDLIRARIQRAYEKASSEASQGGSTAAWANPLSVDGKIARVKRSAANASRASKVHGAGHQPGSRRARAGARKRARKLRARQEEEARREEERRGAEGAVMEGGGGNGGAGCGGVAAADERRQPQPPAPPGAAVAAIAAASAASAAAAKSLS